MPDWNAGQYLRFAGERTRPCRDLAARVEADPRSAIDLGCGPGNSTAVLAERWPEADLTGLDSSEDMLATARRDGPRARWQQGEIASWASASDAPEYDLVFSNAALQWVRDHGVVFPNLLRRGRIVAIQVPAASHAPAQRVMRELAESRAWRGRFLEPVYDWHSHDPGFYYDALAGRATRVDLWQTEYLHIMDNPEAIVEWYRGTGLRPFLSALSAEDAARFVDEYLREIRPSYPPRADGRILFPFLRLFLIAYR